MFHPPFNGRAYIDNSQHHLALLPIAKLSIGEQLTALAMAPRSANGAAWCCD
jgi:hypothetical protein